VFLKKMRCRLLQQYPAFHMSKIMIGRIPLVPLLLGFNALLVLAYLSLIAVVMTYAALHVEFAEQVRSDESAVAKLEGVYFGSLKLLTKTEYANLGYAKPVTKIFVTGASPTALAR
jgi:hypothetical protein